MWDLPGPGLEPMFPALAGRFLTTAPPGKPWLNEFFLMSFKKLSGWGTHLQNTLTGTPLIPYCKSVAPPPAWFWKPSGGCEFRAPSFPTHICPQSAWRSCAGRGLFFERSWESTTESTLFGGKWNQIKCVDGKISVWEEANRSNVGASCLVDHGLGKPVKKGRRWW